MNQEKILVAQRARGALAGFWEFPGGKVESNESDTQALLREIDEELAISIQIKDKLGEFDHHYPGGYLLLVIYIAHAATVSFTTRDHQDAKWVQFSELSSLQMAPADIPVLPELEKWLKSNGLLP